IDADACRRPFSTAAAWGRATDRFKPDHHVVEGGVVNLFEIAIAAARGRAAVSVCPTAGRRVVDEHVIVGALVARLWVGGHVQLRRGNPRRRRTARASGSKNRRHPRQQKKDRSSHLAFSDRSCTVGCPSDTFTLPRASWNRRRRCQVAITQWPA